MALTEEAIQTVMSLMHEDFEKAGVMTESVRREVVMRLMMEEDVITEAIGKYDVMTLIDGSDSVQAIMTEQVGHPIHLFVYLTPEEQLVLTRNNRDIRLVFEAGQTMAHALAFAQRVIDTQRCLRYLGKNGGEILDIGGNYASHRRAARIVHSCTLMDTVRESHRQTERLVNLQSEFNVVDNLQYCTVGAQHCDHKAVQSLSIHTMPDILWEDWPAIMDRHGLAYHIGVFHYDPVMLTQTIGRLEGSDMNFTREGNDVTFHFEMDSSMDYTHKWDNFTKYLSPWCQVSKSSPYAYIYDIKSIVGGVLTAEIVRVPKSAIGRQVKKPFHAYSTNESVVKVKSVLYDIESNLSTDNPNAYIPIEVIVDRDMYKFMLMYGVANDTSSPNKPMDIAEFRSMLMVYNHTRKFGEICITARRTIKGIGIGYVVNALYHVIVRERGLMECKSRAITQSMMLKQRLPNINWKAVAACVPLIPVAAPLCWIGGAFMFYVNKFADALKYVAAGKLAQYETSEVQSYIPLTARGYSEFDGYTVDNEFTFHRAPYLIKPSQANDRTIEGFERHLLVDTSGKSKGLITQGSDTLVASENGEYAPIVLDRAATAFDEGSDQDPQSDSDELNYSDDRGDMLNSPIKGLYDKEFHRYRNTVLEHVTQSKEFVIVKDDEDVHRDFKKMLLEYAVYSFDCGHGVLSTFKTNCSHYVPGGQTHRNRMRDANNASDIGARVFDVQNGLLALEATKYAVGVDPISLQVVPINRSSDGRSATVRSPFIASLYVDNSVKIFNNMLIGRSVIKSWRSNWKPEFTMSLVDGVPGCGKTTEIVNNFTLTSALVCTVRHSKDDSLARLMSLDRFADHRELLRSRVRTVDSVIRNGYKHNGKIDVLFVDEGLMMFPGQLYAVAEKMRPKEVRVYGDSLQIRAIDRSPSLGVLMYSSLKYWNKIEYRDTSHSMPADVTYILGQQYYRRKIFTKSPIRRSLSVNVQHSQESSCFTVSDPSVDYLSILVGDKNKLLSAQGFVDGKQLLEREVEGESVQKSADVARVFTVHESQGQRLDKVGLVRMNPQTCDVLNSKEHIVVALSRHYLQCTYNTVVQTDELVRVMDTKISEEELDNVMLPPDQWLVDKLTKLKSQ